jgi:hypothetical protein
LSWHIELERVRPCFCADFTVYRQAKAHFPDHGPKARGPAWRVLRRFEFQPAPIPVPPRGQTRSWGMAADAFVAP